jgi:hypothetical protein
MTHAALVRMVQPAQHRESAHRPAGYRPGHGSRAASGEALREALMQPGMVVVGEVPPEDEPQVRLAEDEQPVQALPLGPPVLAGWLIRAPFTVSYAARRYV